MRASRNRKEDVLQTPRNQFNGVRICSLKVLSGRLNTPFFIAMGLLGAVAIAAPDADSPAELGSGIELGSLAELSEIEETRCTDCHSFNQIFTHPVDIITPDSMDVPSSLPLIDGRVTCVTCHSAMVDDHTIGRQSVIAGLDFADTGVGMCILCHDSNGFTFQDMHANSIGRAHV